MPILPPSLDDRRFDDLVNELIARIPAHTPEWTNPRQGDPGRTLIELFAWLTDTLLYRANLIPERQRLVFLKLLGVSLKPALPATGIVSLAFAQPTQLSAVTLAPGARVKGAMPFETLAETTVLPVTAEAYYKRPLTSTEAAKRGELLNGLASVHRGVVGSGGVKGYETTAVFASGRAEVNGIDVIAQSADRALWVALLAPLAPQPAQQADFNTAAQKALGGGDAGNALLSVGVVPTLTLPALFEEVGPRAQVPVLWEITTQGSNPAHSDYLTLEPLPGSDSSNGLSQPGVLRLPLPHAGQIWAPENDVGINPAAGVGDNPPRLDDLGKAARLLAWLRLRPRPGQLVDRLALSWLGVNAVPVDQRITLGGRVLGTATGAPDQSFALPQGSVDPDSLQIQVEEPGLGYQNWTRVDDLAAVSRNANALREARAFELDPEAGTLRFGDGVRGRVPENRMRIRLAHGRFGGGRAGNLPAGSLAEVSGPLIDGSAAPPLKLSQPLATAGGEDAESLDAAQQRIPKLLHHRDRAVTADDYRALAMEAPGIDVGRVEILPRFKPGERRFGVPGVVSVMALPSQALGNPPNPRPDRPFIERLFATLSARTPLATELYVIGCEYIALGVSVAVRIADGFGRDAVLFAVRERLKSALWPLAPGGVTGTGWPLGRAVHSRELLVDVARVDGVLEVSGLNLFTKSNNARDWQQVHAAGDGSVSLPLQAWQLPELLGVVVTEGNSAATHLRAIANPFANQNAVAVPVVPETC